MITNTLIVLGLTLGAVGYMKMHMELKDLKAESKCNWSALEYSLENQVKCLEQQIKYGNVAMANHLDMVEENTATSINNATVSLYTHMDELGNNTLELVKNGHIAVSNQLHKVEKETAELINQRTKDINYITTRETNKVIFTPLKCEKCK